MSARDDVPEPADVLGHLRPVRAPDGSVPAPLLLPTTERARRGRLSRAQRAGRTSPTIGPKGTVPPPKDAGPETERKPPRLRAKPLTRDEALRQTATMLDTFCAEALDPTRRASDRKHAAVAWGVSMDKHVTLDRAPASMAGGPNDQPAAPERAALAKRLLGLTAG